MKSITRFGSLAVALLLIALSVGCGSSTITGLPVEDPTPAVTYFDSARVYITPLHSTNVLDLYANTSRTDSCNVEGLLWVGDTTYVLYSITFAPKTEAPKWKLSKWPVTVSPDSALFHFTAPGLSEIQMRRNLSESF